MVFLDAGLFWIAAIIMTMLVAAAIVWPTLRRPVALAPRAEHDVEVYDAQLLELRDDITRGAVPPAEAASARAEIARRLLRASAEVEDEQAPALRRGSHLAAVAVVLVIAAAVPFYIRLGAPSEPDQPLAARLVVDPATADLPTLVAQAETRLRDDPDDGRGWEALVPIYMRLGRIDDAAKAADNAVRLLGSTADRQFVLGSARTQAAGGEVTDAAAQAFEAALKADPENGGARFFLAVRLWQQKKTADATNAWRAIIAKGPADAPWVQASRNALDEAGSAVASAPAPSGPSAADIANASALSDGDRSAMIEGMVSQLSERLKSAPNDPDGWKRLIRSYVVLGKRAEAQEAYTRAQDVFAYGSADRDSIDEFAETLGLADDKATR